MSHIPLEINPLCPPIPFHIVQSGTILTCKDHVTEKNITQAEGKELARKFSLVFWPQYLIAATS